MVFYDGFRRNPNRGPEQERTYLVSNQGFWVQASSPSVTLGSGAPATASSVEIIDA